MAERKMIPPAYRGLLLLSLVLGLAVTVSLALRGSAGIDPTSLRKLLQPEVVLLLAGATVANLGLRFVRWQFFLRRAGLRRPMRESLWIWLASLGLAFVPLFAGEITFKGLMLGSGDRRAERLTWTVAVYERVCDLVAISLIAASAILLASDTVGGGAYWWLFLVPPALFAGARSRRWAVEAARLAVGVIARLVRGAVLADDPDLSARLAHWPRALVGVGLGLVAWAIVCLAAATVVSVSLDDAVGWLAGPLFAQATLLGGASLSPGGAGVTGLFFGHELVRAGAESGAVFASVVAVRALTFWLALAIGQMALLGMAFSHKARATHFDELSPEYDAQIPLHIRQLLVHRKTGRMITLLPHPRGLRGLDIGCGRGWLLAALRKTGAKVTGLDLSAAQARAARQTGAAVIQAGATELPFGPESFDFAYAVNIVHHLPSVQHQRLAFQEAARVLKPGGLFFLHEINVANPIFRFYMGYVFPLVRRIDEGTEFWLDPDSLPLGPDLHVEGVSYFTFVPDFLPSPLLRLALPLERALEESRWARYSAHFMVALRKEKPGAEPQPKAIASSAAPEKN